FLTLAALRVSTLSLHDALPISRHDGAQCGMLARDGRPLREPVVGVPEHPDPAIRPWLGRDPLERVVAVLHLVDVGFGLTLRAELDRKSTRLNSSHRTISYAVFC